MRPDRALELYRQMTRARAFELGLAELWEQGSISGEMHLGTGEEAVAAAIGALLQPDDAVALDHRGTPMLTVLGVDLVALVREMLGDERGLCGGMGGHMHLFVPERRAATSGIVGAAGPTAAGFALSAKRLRPRSVAVAMFGDGAMNQGMLLESFNLAVAWSLPVLFVCKNNQWAITTESSSVSGGRPLERARGFGLPTWDVDGASLKELDEALRELLPRLRRGKGPAFLHARCGRLDGHFLGDPMLKMAKRPMTDGKELFSEVAAATVAKDGGGVLSRASSMITMLTSLGKVRGQARGGRDDPLQRARRELGLKREQLAALDDDATNEVAAAVAEALEEAA